MSHWLTSLSSINRSCQAGLGTFKQVCGLLCEVMTRLFAAEKTASQVDTADVSALFREVTLFYVGCAVQDDESLVRIGNSCLRHLIVNCGQHFQTLCPSGELWEVAASALCLIVRCNLTSVQRLIQSEKAGEQQERQQFRLQHLSMQIFNQPVAESLSPMCSCNLFVALLSYQLAINTIANVVCYSNVILTGNEKILESAVFAENMQSCAAVEPKILAILSGVLRSGCEFGIDFEIALGMRRHLQKLYGFSQLPSLAQVTGLTSDLLIIALTNIALHYSCHMRDLEQWLDFLIDFYFQESGNELAPTDSHPTMFIPEFQLVSSSKSKEGVTSTDNEISKHIEKSTSNQLDTEQRIEGDSNELETLQVKSASIEELSEQKPLIKKTSDPLETKEENDSSSQSPSSSESLSGEKTPQEDDHIDKQQMEAALESYRRQKRLQTRIINSTEPKSVRVIKAAPEIISKVILLSAIRLLSLLDKSVQNSFQIVWNIMSRLNLHCSDQQIRKAHEEFEKLFPLYPSESDGCQNPACP